MNNSDKSDTARMIEKFFEDNFPKTVCIRLDDIEEIVLDRDGLPYNLRLQRKSDKE